MFLSFSSMHFKATSALSLTIGPNINHNPAAASTSISNPPSASSSAAPPAFPTSSSSSSYLQTQPFFNYGGSSNSSPFTAAAAQAQSPWTTQNQPLPPPNTYASSTISAYQVRVPILHYRHTFSILIDGGWSTCYFTDLIFIGIKISLFRVTKS
jgi:hypothetical protein